MTVPVRVNLAKGRIGLTSVYLSRVPTTGELVMLKRVIYQVIAVMHFSTTTDGVDAECQVKEIVRAKTKKTDDRGASVPDDNSRPRQSRDRQAPRGVPRRETRRGLS